MIFLRNFALVFLLLVAATAHSQKANGIDIALVPAITDNYILDDYRPADLNRDAQISMAAAPDEYEPASFVIIANEQVDNLQLIATNLVDAEGVGLAGAELDLRIVKRWYQRNMARSDPADLRLRFMTPELLVYDDTLVKVEGQDNYLRLPSGEYRRISKPGRVGNAFITPGIDELPVRDAYELQPLSLGKGSNRQIWVTLHVPENAKAGNYRAEIRLVEGDETLKVIPVFVEVLPFQLDEPQIDYSIYYRGMLDKNWPDGSVSSEFKSESQMLSDFQNLVAHGIKNPTVYQFYATGLLKNVMSLRKQAGMDKPRLYYLGLIQASGEDQSVPPRLPGKVRDVLSITGRYGVDEVYFYARDEAKGQEIAHQYPYWNAVIKAGGKIMAAGWQTDGRLAGNFDITGGKEDLFVSLGMARYQEARRWHSAGSLIYSYQNPTGGWELPETWRRNYGLLLWQNEYDGAMPYAWQHSFGDAWNDFDQVGYKDHNFTYPTVDGQIDTLQWEGLREGVDDMRYLATLLNELADAKISDSLEAVDARVWLRSLKTRPLGQSDLSTIRAEMVAHILALKNSRANTAEPVSRVSILPIQPGGVATVTWETEDRAPGFLQVKDGGKSIRASSRGLALHHELTVAELQPGRKYPFSVYSSVDTEDIPLSHEGVIDTAPALNLSATSTKTDTALAVNVEIESNYRASIGVDWQRSLSGWWRFSAPEAAGVDSSTWGNEAALKGDASLAEGWFGKGVSLDGAGDFINIPDIEIPENGTATIEGWFRFRSFAMDNRVNMGLFSGVYQHMTNNHLYFIGTNDFFIMGSMLQLNTWHHIAVSWDGDTATALAYIDGQRVRVATQGEIEKIRNIDGLNIGRSTGYLGGIIRGTDTFDGDIDEVRVWNRVLSEAEIQASYDSHQSSLRFEFPLDVKKKPEFSLVGANAADKLAVE